MENKDLPRKITMEDVLRTVEGSELPGEMDVETMVRELEGVELPKEIDDGDTECVVQQMIDRERELAGSPRVKDSPSHLEKDKKKSWEPPLGLGEGQVVLLKKDYVEVKAGSIGVMIYYLSVETFGPGQCQVMFYLVDNEGPYCWNEDTITEHLEPAPSGPTPWWVPFDVNKEGFPVKQDEPEPDRGNVMTRGLGRIRQRLRFFLSTARPTGRGTSTTRTSTTRTTTPSSQGHPGSSGSNPTTPPAAQ